MPWVPDAFSGGVIWQDKPSVATALDASNLNLEEQLEAAYAVAQSQSVVDYFEGGHSAFGHANWLGINSNTVSGYGPRNEWTSLGYGWDRQDISRQGVHTPAQVVASVQGMLAQGATNVVVEIQEAGYSGGGAFPTGSTAINAYAAYVVSVIQAVEAAVPDTCVYELINEVWNFYSGGQGTATTYANLVVVVLNACQAAGLDLTRIYPMVADQSWPAAMMTAQPTLQNLIEGWAVHPYGSPPPGYAQSTTQGLSSVTYFRRVLSIGAAGVPFPGANNILISEIGIQDRTLNAAATGEQVANTATLAFQWTLKLLSQAQKMRAAGWLTAMLIYSRSDVSSGYALNQAGGALTNTGQALAQFPLEADADSPPYTAADDGYVAVTADPWLFGDAVQLTASSKEHLFMVRIRKRSFSNTMLLYTDGTSAPSGLTAGASTVGVRDIFGNLLASTHVDATSTDLATKFAVANSKITITVGNMNLRPGTYLVSVGVAGTTMPKFRGRANVDQGWAGGGSALPTRQMVASAAYTTNLPSTLDVVGAVGRLSFGMFAALL